MSDFIKYLSIKYQIIVENDLIMAYYTKESIGRFLDYTKLFNSIYVTCYINSSHFYVTSLRLWGNTPTVEYQAGGGEGGW